MNIVLSHPEIGVDNERIYGTLLSPAMAFPGLLFVHGWGGSQDQDLARAREISGLGCVCLTVDLRGHGRNAQQADSISRAQNLRDLIAAYDWLAARSDVETTAIAVVGISYGGYLAAILSSLRSVRWLALRAPALYKDEGWELPKRQLHADKTLIEYRRNRVAATDNVALQACTLFRGDALIIESEFDTIVPHPVIENYVASLNNTRSLTARVISGADHALSEQSAQQDYTALLINWLTEMIAGARAHAAKSQLQQIRQDDAAN
ncbi:MAG TPA: alpha/beta fold hydrolase [Spongiibacteraceae bacterium]